VVGVYYGEYERVAPIIAANPHIDAIAADLREVAENYRVVAYATATYGGVDAFIANSGVTVFGSIVEMTDSTLAPGV
jgi:NAD(P)-dependent dehydrogenase (short-subunit alcohol dehydrogenase family)